MYCCRPGLSFVASTLAAAGGLLERHGTRLLIVCLKQPAVLRHQSPHSVPSNRCATPTGPIALSCLAFAQADLIIDRRLQCTRSSALGAGDLSCADRAVIGAGIFSSMGTRGVETLASVPAAVRARAPH